jgi:DNA-binding transcriptional LysR family regulator
MMLAPVAVSIRTPRTGNPGAADTSNSYGRWFDNCELSAKLAGMDLDLAQVRAFVVAAEQLHFGRAAAKLFLTQQALSKRIQRLEQTLGEPLFLRSQHGVQLSEAGRRFLPHARELLATADTATAAINAQSRPLQVDVWAHAVAPAGLARHLVQERPDLVLAQSMRRSLPAALQALQRGELDACFGRVHDLGQSWPSELAHRLVSLEGGVVALGATHPLADAPLLRPQDLGGSHLWFAAAGSSPEMIGYMRRFAEQFGVPLVTEGQNLGLGEYVWGVLRDDPTLITIFGRDWPVPADGSVVTVPLQPRPCYPWSLIWRKEDRRPRLRQLIELAAETGHSEGWLAHDSDRDWLPDVDLADLAAAMPAATHDNRTLAADQPARPARRSANGA